MVKLRRTGEGLLVGLRVSPAAKKTRFQGSYGERLKVQIASAPENDKANRELERVFADWLRVPPDYVSLHSGHKSRDKELLVRGLTEDQLRQRLSRLAP
ncbi:MAG: hypothetical protein Kow00129_14220 [Thermoleophilia bacterium]